MKLQIPKQPILDELQKLEKEYLALLAKRSEIEKNIPALEEKINSLASAYEIIFGEKPSTEALPIKTFLHSNASLGDALETILKEHKTLEVNKAIELLREKRVRLSLKNPRNVLANLVKNDKRGRFTRLDDGRIVLREK